MGRTSLTRCINLEPGAERLLIVDDDPELLRFLMEEPMAPVIGASAATTARTPCCVGARTHDLVVLDWTLPDFSGVELCRLHGSGNTTPVLMLTARDDVDERVQALDAGVDDYLTKPFNLKELHARVRARCGAAAMNKTHAAKPVASRW